MTSQTVNEGQTASDSQTVNEIQIVSESQTVSQPILDKAFFAKYSNFNIPASCQHYSILKF